MAVITGSGFITGSALDDTITGSAANDTIDGAGGVDEVVYAGNRDGYQVISINPSTWQVVDIDPSDGDDGTDELYHIGMINFADTRIGGYFLGSYDFADSFAAPDNGTWVIQGYSGKDTLTGGYGEDWLFGGGDSDVIDGGGIAGYDIDIAFYATIAANMPCFTTAPVAGR